MGRPVPLNDLDRAIKAAIRRVSAAPELYRQLGRGELYALVPYHPEVEGNALSVQNGSRFPFVILQDEDGPFVPIFSSEERVQESLRRAGVPPRTVSMASLKAVDLLQMIGGSNQRAVLNKSCATGQLSLPPNLLRDVASGKAFEPAPLDDIEPVDRVLTILTPEERPIGLVQAAFEILRAHEPFRAAWVLASGRTPAGAPVLPWHLLVHMEPRDAAIFHELNMVVSRASLDAGETIISLSPEDDEAAVQSLFTSGNPFFVRQS